MDRLSPWPCQSCIAHDLRISPGRPRNTFMYTDTALWSFSLVAIRRYSRSTRLSAVGLFCIRRRRQVTESPSSFGKPPNQKPANQERMPFFLGGGLSTPSTLTRTTKVFETLISSDAASSLLRDCILASDVGS